MSIRSNFPNLPARLRLSCVAVELRDFSSDESYLKWKANSRLDWAWQGFDSSSTAHYLDGFHEIRRLGTSGPPKVINMNITSRRPGSLTFRLPTICLSSAGRNLSLCQVGKEHGSGVANRPEPALRKRQVSHCLAGSSYSTTPKLRSVATTSLVMILPMRLRRELPGFLYDLTGRFVYVSLQKEVLNVRRD